MSGNANPEDIKPEPKEETIHRKQSHSGVLYAVVAILAVAVVVLGVLYATGAFSAKSTTNTVTNLSISSFGVSPANIAVGATTYVNVTATGGTTPYSYGYSGLPTGCTSSNVTILTCVPTASGTFTISVTVTDSKGKTATSSAPLNVVAGVAIASFTATPNPVTVNSTTIMAVDATSGVTPYSYAYTGLPTGCASANTAVLNCTPTVTGSFNPQVTATDANGKTNSRSLTLVVNPQGADTLAITAFAATPSSVDVNGTTTLSVAASGGVTPYTYAYTGLPNGCSSANLDVLTCTPTKAGVFPITVSVTDAKQFTKTAELNLSVTAPVNCAVPSGQTATGSGSTFVAPLVDTWITDYTTSTINYDAVGSGTGIANFQALTYDFGATDAPMSSSQVKATTAGQALTIPWSAGAVASIYNLGGMSLKVNGTFLAEAFMGQITNWNDTLLQALNPSSVLPNDTITLVHRSDGSGTSYVFQQFLSDENALWKADYGYSTTWLGPSVLGEQAEKGSSGVSNYVAQHEYTLSYVDLTYVLTTTGISAAAVENPSGKFITPTINDTENAIHNITSQPGFTFPNATDYQGWQNVSMLNSPGINDYPLATFTYILVYQQPDKVGFSSGVMSQDIAKALWQFINWATSSSGGQSYSTGVYFVPLAASVQELDHQSLNLMTWGGQPVYPAACDA
jgi:phosphate transport system permease protein/phosphate transport system substrate-binding protein